MSPVMAMTTELKPHDGRVAGPERLPPIPGAPVLIFTRARRLGHITDLLLADRPLSAAEWAEIEAAERSAA